MKTLIKYPLILAALFVFSVGAQAQNPLQYYRSPGKSGLNKFETSKTDTVKYDGFKVRVGGDFAMQFQGLNQSNDKDSLVELGSNMNLPTANLNIDVQLQKGLRMHLRTYLSSRHHQESWVKGGYLQIDNLDFINPGFLSGFMDIATIRVGMDEINYGDAHFRRSDNGKAIYNPFVGNYIMDAFTTETFGEVNIQTNGLVAVVGVSNGKLNQGNVVNDKTDNKLSLYGKVGYDKQISDDLRVRLTGSWYINKGTTNGTYLYGGDRAGARYYNVVQPLSATADNPFSGRVNAKFKEITAIQINPFVKFKGLEFFGIYEIASGSGTGEGKYTQIAGELLYRIGANEKTFVGGRYNLVKGNTVSSAPDQEISRINLGGGWFMTENIVAKVEYVKQAYKGDAYVGSDLQGAQFNGFMVEAVISF